MPKYPKHLSKECAGILAIGASTLSELSPTEPQGVEFLRKIVEMVDQVMKERSVLVQELIQHVGSGDAGIREQAHHFQYRDDALNILRWCKCQLMALADPTYQPKTTVPKIVDDFLAAHERITLPTLPERRPPPEFIVGDCPKMLGVVRQIGLYARPHINVVLFGESGTGKEMVADQLHRRSRTTLDRERPPIRAVNCAALPHALLESELFGHKKGAFTGADTDRVGLYESANHGTLFLDEVGEMPHSIQVQLLRVLQNHKVRRLGENRERGPFDVKVIAATNADLPAMVADGRFRTDLFYRLRKAHIRLPPLRDREDKDHLLDQLLEQEQPGLSMSSDARSLIWDSGLPGNVRQLSHLVEMGAIESGGEQIQIPHLEHHLGDGSGGILSGTNSDLTAENRLVNGMFTSTIDTTMGYHKALKLFGAALAEVAIDRSGTTKDAAEELGVYRQTLSNAVKTGREILKSRGTTG